MQLHENNCALLPLAKLYFESVLESTMTPVKNNILARATPTTLNFTSHDVLNTNALFYYNILNDPIMLRHQNRNPSSLSKSYIKN